MKPRYARATEQEDAVLPRRSCMPRGARPSAAGPGARGRVTTRSSTRETLHDVREFVGCVSFVASVECWGGGLPMASKGAEGADGDDQRRVTTRRISLVPVPSIAEHLGCKRIADGGPGGRAGGGNPCKSLVGAPGFEPGTSSLSEKRSNRLSYAPTGALESMRAAAGGQPRAATSPSAAWDPGR